MGLSEKFVKNVIKTSLVLFEEEQIGVRAISSGKAKVKYLFEDHVFFVMMMLLFHQANVDGYEINGEQSN